MFCLTVHNLSTLLQQKFGENAAKLAAIIALHNLWDAKVTQPVLKLPLASFSSLANNRVCGCELAEMVFDVKDIAVY